MGIFNEGFEEEIHVLRQRIEVLENHLLSILEISTLTGDESCGDLEYNLDEIRNIIQEILDL